MTGTPSSPSLWHRQVCQHLGYALEEGVLGNASRFCFLRNQRIEQHNVDLEAQVSPNVS